MIRSLLPLLLHTIYDPVIFSRYVHLKLGHRFHALLKICSDHDDIVPLNLYWLIHDRLDQSNGSQRGQIAI